MGIPMDEKNMNVPRLAIAAKPALSHPKGMHTRKTSMASGMVLAAMAIWIRAQTRAIRGVIAMIDPQSPEFCRLFDAQLGLYSAASSAIVPKYTMGIHPITARSRSIVLATFATLPLQYGRYSPVWVPRRRDTKPVTVATPTAMKSVPNAPSKMYAIPIIPFGTRPKAYARLPMVPTAMIAPQAPTPTQLAASMIFSLVFTGFNMRDSSGGGRGAVSCQENGNRNIKRLPPRSFRLRR